MSLVIQVEGLDGVGKSTLVEALAKELPKDSAFHPWIYASKEPGSIWSGKTALDLRKMVLETPDFQPLERELLFMADASLHRRFIERQEEAIIISDRGYWSHLAYLRGYLKTKKIDHDDYSLCRSIAERVCRKPDCVIFLNGDLKLMEERSRSKQKDVIESLGEAFFSTVYETYQDLVKTRELEGKPLLVLNATNQICVNIMEVVSYLKEVFSHEELRTGNRVVCRV